MERKPITILGAARTAIGTFGGMFANTAANERGIAPGSGVTSRGTG
jgi:hypothetical protein